MAGLTGADHENVPWVNHLVDAVRDQVGLEHGVTTPIWDALISGAAPDLLTLAQKASSGGVTFRLPEKAHRTRARRAARTAVGRGIRTIDKQRATRERLITRHGDPKQKPWIYLIVATGDIREDIPQAQEAAREGADIIAVIRSTGQSLLDFVPEGETHEGYAGTYATQENFRLMRAALDESSKELGRYIRLTNYASGLCMPEIAAMGERFAEEGPFMAGFEPAHHTAGVGRIEGGGQRVVLAPELPAADDDHAPTGDRDTTRARRGGALVARDGGVARMSDPEMIEGIKAAVTIPVMAKARIGHFVEAQILEALGVDYIDESEVLAAEEIARIDGADRKHDLATGFQEARAVDDHPPEHGDLQGGRNGDPEGEGETGQLHDATLSRVWVRLCRR